MSGSIDEVTSAALLRDLRERVFRLGARPPLPRRIGAEVEWIPVSAETRGILPIVGNGGLPSSRDLLRRFGAGRGWREEVPVNGPRFRLPCGGIVAWEPGGQIEFSTRPYRSATALLDALRSVVDPLRAMAAGEGIELLSVGIDPHSPVEAAPLRLSSDRYACMAAYFDTIGPAGARMMRQTASFQLNLDWEDEPLPRWRVLNAAAPYITAIFANSPLYAGRPTGFRSFRAGVWRELDPARTGLPGVGADAVGEYLGFALRAPAMLRPTADGEYLPFAEWIERGEVSLADWHAHLTTLFPEVRPKGHIEIRSADAVDPRWYAAPVALLAAITYHPPSLCAAAELLGAPDPGLLGHAGRFGLSDPRIAAIARDLFGIALAGCAALGTEFIDPPSVEAAHEFFDRYTRRARSPAEDALPLPRSDICAEPVPRLVNDPSNNVLGCIRPIGAGGQ